MTSNKEFYNFVVIGTMNPRIHTPGWYRLVDLIDQSEMDDAVNSTDTMTTLPLSQLSLKSITIACTPDRWEIQTTDAKCLKRLQDMTARVFDDLLRHTQVLAIGFNFNYERTTDIPNVARYLASCLVKTRTGLRDESLLSGELSLRRSLEGCTSLVAIRPKEGPGAESVVCVLNNYEYKFSGDKGFFNLGETISVKFSADQRDAEEQTSRVLQALNESLER
jgi:hypothetical protein